MLSSFDAAITSSRSCHRQRFWCQESTARWRQTLLAIRWQSHLTSSFRVRWSQLWYLGIFRSIFGSKLVSSSVEVSSLMLMKPFSLADVFHNLKQFGRFNAILLTYLISSSLHGLNFQLAAVLLSIGVFTFVEFRLRNVLAEILDGCVAANKCNQDSVSSCTKGHKNTPALMWVKMINFAFGIFTVVLLAYLGVLLDTSTEPSAVFSWHQNLKKWIDLKFFGHAIVLIWYFAYLILRNWTCFREIF